MKKSLLARTACALIAFVMGGTATNVSAADESSSLPVMRITLSAEITKDMEYANGTMSLTDTDNSTVTLAAKFKTRGATAAKYLSKPALNMKLRTDDYASSRDSSLLGLRSISSYILDAMAIDRICMRNRVMMDVWNSYSSLPYETDFNGRHGTEGRFIELYINDEYYGIYCLSDKINRKLLDLKKYDTDKNRVRGVLYKSGTNDISYQDTVCHTDDYTAYVISYHNAFELKEPEDYECEEAWQPLLDLYNGTQSYAMAEKYFFQENLVDYQLLILAFCIADNWGNKNHFLSIRNIQKDIDDADSTEAAKRKFVLTPWDLDAALGGKADGSCYDGNYRQWAISAAISNGGFYPFGVCQGNSDYKAALKARWEELRSTTMAVDSIKKRMTDYADLFTSSGAWDRNVAKYSSYYVTDLDKEVGLIGDWYEARHAEMDEYFGITTAINSIKTVATQTDTYDIFNTSGTKVATLPASVVSDNSALRQALGNRPTGVYVARGGNRTIKLVVDR